MSKPNSKELADVQGGRDDRNIAIDAAGIKDIRYPLTVQDAGQVQHTVAVCNMYVGVPADHKGTHMSRLVAALDAQRAAVTVENFPQILLDIRARLQAHSGQITLQFPFFRRKTAPVSGAQSLLDYAVTLRCEMDGDRLDAYTQVVVPVTSLCPCSKKISAYGAHNQRAHVTVEVRAQPPMGISELIAVVENQASAELYGLLKRADEKFVTERAYDNPKFVEDVARDVAAALNQDARIQHYTLAVENFESIHNHSAYARITRAAP